MRKILAIAIAAALLSGTAVIIAWACCGGATPTAIKDITVTPDPVPCGGAEVEICFDVDVYITEEQLDQDVFADVYIDGQLIADNVLVYDAVDGPPWPTPYVTITVEDVCVSTALGPGVYDDGLIIVFDGDVITEPIPTIVVEPCEVPVDMKGGSCPNSFNRAKKGVLPVAILEGGDVSLAEIDPDSITVGGVAVIPGMSIMEDSTEPPTGDPADCYDCFDAPDDYMGDGVDELVVYVDAPTLVDANPNGLADAIRDDCIELVVEGMTYDGRAIIGSDSLRIIK